MAADAEVADGSFKRGAPHALFEISAPVFPHVEGFPWAAAIQK